MKPSMAIIERIRTGPWVPPSLGKAPYLWAFSLTFLFWKYVYAAPEPLELAAMALTVALFLPLYFASFWASGAQAQLAVALSCGFGVLWAPHNLGASSFFIFAAAMCAAILPARRAYAALAVVQVLGVLVAVTLAPMPLVFLLPTLAVGLPVGLAAFMDASLRRSRDQLLRKQEEVEHMARLAERERISRDLHDLLGHTLSLITVKAELAGKLASRDMDACRAEIGDIERCARNALSEVRAAVTGYRQSGLAHEVASARASLAAAGIELEARIDAQALPVAAENVLALALREAVTNILRHAGASRCEVALTRDRGMIRLRIVDNGATLAEGAPVRHGNGLNGMREKVESLGGQLALHVERGLALELSLPIGDCA